MKRSLAIALVSALLGSVPAAFAQTNETTANTQVTLTVTQFRPLSFTGKMPFVDATTALAAHPSVTLVDQGGMPTLVCKQAANIELSVVSADPSQTYIPVAVSYLQLGAPTPETQDPFGNLNFEQISAQAGKLIFRNKAINRGGNGQYEFFVLVQRVPDGSLGLIDPIIVTDNNE
jgi:hypothetical protein